MFSLVSCNKPRDMSAPIIIVNLYKRYRAVAQTISQMSLIRPFGKFLIAKIYVFNSTTSLVNQSALLGDSACQSEIISVSLLKGLVYLASTTCYNL